MRYYLQLVLTMQERFASTARGDGLPVSRGTIRRKIQGSGSRGVAGSPWRAPAAFLLRMEHHSRTTTVSGRTVSRGGRKKRRKNGSRISLERAELDGRGGSREKANGARSERTNERTYERMDGRTVERGKRTRTNRTARGFSGRLRGCSSPLVRHGPLADPWWPPRGSERLFSPPRRTVLPLQRSTGETKRLRAQLAFFDPPSRGLPPLSRAFSLSRARAAAAVRTPLHAALRFDSPRGHAVRSPANGERMCMRTTSGVLVCVCERAESLAAIASLLRSKGSS